MSASTDLRALLLSGAALALLVGTRVFADRAEQKTPRPFAIYTITQTEPQYALDNSEHGRLTVFELQCWADTRSVAEALADAAEAALRDDFRVILSRSGGYDAELDLELTSLSVEWWE